MNPGFQFTPRSRDKLPDGFPGIETCYFLDSYSQKLDPSLRKDFIVKRKSLIEDVYSSSSSIASDYNEETSLNTTTIDDLGVLETSI